MHVASGLLCDSRRNPCEIRFRVSIYWENSGVNRVAKTLNGWQQQIHRSDERDQVHAKTFPASILSPLSSHHIWPTACHTWP